MSSGIHGAVTMPSIRISKATVDAAQIGDRDRVFWDRSLSGFGLKVTPKGRKVYLYRYRMAAPGKAAKTHPITLTLGKHGEITPDQARDAATALAGKIAAGEDPRADARRKLIDDDNRARLETGLAFDRKAEQWLAHYEHEKSRRPSSVAQARVVVRRYLKPALKDRPLSRIGRADLQPIFDAIPTSRKATRRSVFAYASVLFGWAAARGDIDRNPLAEMGKPEAPRPRGRVLSDPELLLVWGASAALSAAFGTFYRLLILTGQRRDEVATLRWNELDRATGTWLIPADRAKNSVAHVVPLSAPAIVELDNLANSNADWPRSGYVLTSTGAGPIGGFSKAKLALDAIITETRGAPLPGWRVHDLRRTLATGLQRLGVRFEVTEAVLNHVSGARGGVAGIYQRHDWAAEKRAALEAWGAHVESLRNGAWAPKVVWLAEARA
jgi:integrase